MIYFDLLYPSKEDRESGRSEIRVNDELFDDLQLIKLISGDIMNESDYVKFKTEIAYLPTDKEVILFRQRVLEDYKNNPLFISDLLQVCSKLKEKTPERKYNIWDTPIPYHKKLKEYLDLLKYNYAILYSTKFNDDYHFESEVFQNVVKFLNNQAYQDNLMEIINKVSDVLDAKSIEFSVNNTFGLILNHVRLVSLKNEMQIPFMVEGKWRKKSIVNEECYLDASQDWILESNLNEIYTKTLIRLCDFIIQVNNCIVKAFKNIERDSSYYEIGIKLLKYYKELHIPFCKPEILSTEDSVIDTKDLYNVVLSIKLKKNKDESDLFLQCNDYSNYTGKIAVITGINSGGKTEFLRSLGYGQIFMQLGYMLPAKTYSADIVNYIGTLFSSDEDTDTVHGKLEKELVDIKKISRNMKPRSLLLMNEILATTSEEEGTLIACDVIRAFAETKSNIICVTHLYDLAIIVVNKELILPKGEEAINYIAEMLPDNNGEMYGTYRIVRGRPEKNIWVKEVMKNIRFNI